MNCVHPSPAVRTLPVSLLLMSCLLFGLSVAAAEVPEGFTPLLVDDGFDGWHGRPHYDPRKLAAMSDDERRTTLDGWRKDTLAHWRIENGEIINDGHGPYLTTDREFGDFELLLEYRTVAKADSGIYLRGNPQVQIWDWTEAGGKWNRGADKGSGGLFNNARRAPGQEPLVLADRPFGEWNQFRIRQIGARTDVWLNDKLVVDHEIMENYWDRARPQFRTGPIQLQTHGGEIRWRNLFIREFTPDEANEILRSKQPEYVSLFDGNSLSGWQGDADSYEVANGAIRCKAGKGGNLFTTDEYADFEVELEFQLPPGGNNGLAIRFPGEGRPHLHGMCELQVLDSEHPQYATLDARQYHGSAYGIAAAHRGFLRPTGEWNFQRVKVLGSTIQVELNGFLILNTDVSKVKEFKDGSEHTGLHRTSGYFGFAGHNDPVAFRQIRIRRIDSKETAALRTWPQFRGHNSSGLAVTDETLPEKFGPETAVIWKTPLPAGHSSPVLSENHIFVTAVRDQELLTIALDRASGKVLWEKAAPHSELEEIHQIGSYAQCSPATDGDVVISLFGSAGMFAYDLAGHELWTIPMGPFVNEFGAGTSPIIIGEQVITVQDHDQGSFLLAVDRRSGKQLWKTDRSEFPRNYCSPVLWSSHGRTQIVVAGTLRVAGYDLETGEEVWTARGLSRAVCVTPVVGDDGRLYVAGWANGGDSDDRIVLPEWDAAVKMWDAGGNSILEESELEPQGDIQRRFKQFDRDRSGGISQDEYTWYRDIFDTATNVIMAVNAGGKGDITNSHVAWRFEKFLPFCSSPLYVHGYVFMVKNGGIVTSLNAINGEPLKTARVPGTGNYYASPVAADNRVILADQKGHVSVISSYAEWAVQDDVDFGEEIYATPAIVNGRLYLRTNGHLYCFGKE